jgi:steroid 5-alpha reductase family enzyme
MMEKHLLARRPGYAAYQQQVSAFVPWFRKRAAIDLVSERVEKSGTSL